MRKRAEVELKESCLSGISLLLLFADGEMTMVDERLTGGKMGKKRRRSERDRKRKETEKGRVFLWKVNPPFTLALFSFALNVQKLISLPLGTVGSRDDLYNVWSHRLTKMRQCCVTLAKRDGTSGHHPTAIAHL